MHSRWIREYVFTEEEFFDLLSEFTQELPRECFEILPVLSELYELDDVSAARLTSLTVYQFTFLTTFWIKISVQEPEILAHIVFVSNSDEDDADRLFGRLANSIDSRFHVCDFTSGYQEQDRVELVVLADRLNLRVVDDILDRLGVRGRPVRSDPSHTLHIVIEKSFHAE